MVVSVLVALRGKRLLLALRLVVSVGVKRLVLALRECVCGKSPFLFAGKGGGERRLLLVLRGGVRLGG